MQNKFYQYEKNLSPTRKKELGIVYTPYSIVDEINDNMLSAWKGAHPPKVLDPCCGTGIFLFDMADKISQRWSIPIEQVYKQYIYGFDIDSDAVNIGLENMKSSNLVACDSLKQDYTAYDIIVTNPPYIRIQNLSEQQRVFIQKEFSLTKGDTDLYVAFIEKICKSEKPAGFIAPHSWARNKSAASLRQFIFDGKLIKKIKDYGGKKVFKNVGTYTSIVYTGKSNQLEYISPNGERKRINYEDSCRDLIFIGEKSTRNNGSVSVLDICDINVGLATLADKFFYGEMLETTTDNCVLFKNSLGTYEIEKNILVKCVKASKIQNVKENTFIIFPYVDGKLIEEDILKSKYPKIYELMLRNKKYLSGRDKGKIDEKKWYGFGRTQGLKLKKEKFLLPPFQKDKLVMRPSSSEELFISGYSITPKKGFSFEQIEKILTSNEVFEQLKKFGKPMSKGWLGLSKTCFKNCFVAINNP